MPLSSDLRKRLARTDEEIERLETQNLELKKENKLLKWKVRELTLLLEKPQHTAKKS